jgi:3'(2'), 5'-bisphosphate nucleotidase
MKVMYSAAEGKAWKEECGVRKQIQVRDARPPLVVISRSHSDSELQEYLQQLGEHQTTSIGSSLKFCLVAEGHAQLYPLWAYQRLGYGGRPCGCRGCRCACS